MNEEKTKKIRFVFFLDFFVFRVLAKNSKKKKKAPKRTVGEKSTTEEKRKRLALAHIYYERRATRGSVKREERGARGARGAEREIEKRRDLIK